MEIIFNKGKSMYFIKNQEVSEPKLLNTPVYLNDGREIIGFSERGKKKFMWTSDDLKNADITNKVVDIPNWLKLLDVESN